MKRLIAFVLTLTLILSCISVNAAAAPADIENHWAKAYIERLMELGIVAGNPDGSIKPDDNIAVDQFIKIVVCSLGQSFTNGEQYWAKPFMDYAISKQLISADEFDSYGRPITRQEAAKIIVKALNIREMPDFTGIDKCKAKIADYSSITKGFEDYVLAAAYAGLFTGFPDGTFRPKNKITRAEAFVIVLRLIDPSLRQPMLTQADITELVPELKVTDAELWGREDIYKICSYYAYKVIDGVLHFTDIPHYDNYVVKETVTPDLNKKLYELTKALIDDNHYVSTTYVPEIVTSGSGYVQPATVHVGLSKSAGYAFNSIFFFKYHFYETIPFDNRADNSNNKQKDKLSDNVAFTLNISKLFWDLTPDGKLYDADKDGFSTPFYEDKLKKSMVVLFGSDTGTKIYNYILPLHNDRRVNNSKYNEVTIVKIIDNIQIDFVSEPNGNGNFKFTYLR